MRLTDEAQGAVEFGRFRLLPHRRELRADGVVVELGSRAFDILMVLTEARGALVTKDEIMARVWPGTVVEENNLVVQISGSSLASPWMRRHQSRQATCRRRSRVCSGGRPSRKREQISGPVLSSSPTLAPHRSDRSSLSLGGCSASV
jgi:Transcriptional regulatory protein, C terminal